MEVIAELLANSAFRLLVENIAIQVIADLFHRRAANPDFLAQSDAAFRDLAQAKTPEEQLIAQNAIRVLMAESSGS